jgi:hypothetical protein
VLDVLPTPAKAVIVIQVFSATSSMRARRMPLSAQSFAASVQESGPRQNA